MIIGFIPYCFLFCDDPVLPLLARTVRATATDMLRLWCTGRIMITCGRIDTLFIAFLDWQGWLIYSYGFSTFYSVSEFRSCWVTILCGIWIVCDLLTSWGYMLRGFSFSLIFIIAAQFRPFGSMHNQSVFSCISTRYFISWFSFINFTYFFNIVVCSNFFLISIFRENCSAMHDFQCSLCLLCNSSLFNFEPIQWNCSRYVWHWPWLF